MKRLLFTAVCSLGVAHAATAGIDSVNYEPSSGLVTLTLSGIAEDKQVYAARAANDCGSAASGWQEADAAKLLDVPAGSSDASVRLPASWRVSGGKVRLFLINAIPYVPVRYLRTSGGVWMDTGVIPTAKTSIEIKCRQAGNNYPLFGIEDKWFAFCNGYDWNKVVRTYCCFMGQEEDVDPYNDGDVHEVSFGSAGLVIDGDNKTGALSAGAKTVSSSFPLFGRRADNTTGTPNRLNNDGDIYWCRLSEDGVPVRNYKACTLYGMPAFYDAVNGTFLTNLGDGQLTAGPVALDIGTPDSVSGVISVEPEVRAPTAANYDVASGTITVTFPAGTQNKAVYLAYATLDNGTSITGWSTVRQVATLGANETSISFVTPQDWRTGGVVRVFVGPTEMASGTRLHSLHSTGNNAATPYCDTKLIPNLTTSLAMDCKLNAVGDGGNNMPGFGVAEVFYLFGNGPGTYWGFGTAFGGLDKTPHATKGVRHWDRLGFEGAFINQTRQADRFVTAEASTKKDALTFFGRRSGYKMVSNSDMTLYSVVLSHDGRSYDYVPAVDADGQPGLYDRIGGGWLYNDGGGAFDLDADLVVGEEVTAAMCDATTIRTFIGPSVSHEVLDRRITVTVGAGTTDVAVFAARAASDCGTLSDDWDETCYLGDVSAAGGTFSFTLPVGWRRAGTVTRVFLTGKEMPYGTACSFIRATGAQYVDTGVVPDAKTEIVLRMKLVGKNTIPSFGVEDAFYCFGSPNQFWGFFGANGSFAWTNDNDWHTLRFGPNGAFIDGVEKLPASGILPTMEHEKHGRTLPLFGRIRLSDGKIAWLQDDMSLALAKIVRDGVVLRNYLPCVKDGVAGLYDQVSRQFFGNGYVDENPFEAGEACGKVLIDGEVLNCSEAQVAPRCGMVLQLR